MIQKIVPHLWFNKEAVEAAEFYVAAFSNLPSTLTQGASHIVNKNTLYDTPSGTVETVVFELAGYRYAAISAGPLFKINPSVSFILNFDPSHDENARGHLDALWATLSEGGTALMPLQAYPFSKHYGWIQDKYGVSWQLMLTDPTGEKRPFITPSLMFVGDVCGKAEEATNFYLSVFKDAQRGTIAHYPKDMEPDKEGNIMFTDFTLAGQWFAAMESAHKHAFAFNEAISLMVYCEDQAEIDYYWQKLSAVPEAEQCGWLKDAYGVSWQIVPRAMDEMMKSGDKERMARVTKAFLAMKKFDLAALQKAYEG